MNKLKKNNTVKQIDLTFLKAIIECNDPDKMLYLARYYGQFHWVNITDRWSAIPVEEHTYKLIAPMLSDIKCSDNRTSITHVISEGYDHGGHTPICVNLIKAQKQQGDAPQLYVTRHITQKIANELQQADVPIIQDSSKNVAQIRSLTETLLNSKAVVLHIHPDDIVACVAAMHAERCGIPCYFVNHANIHFSYGPSQCTAILEITGSSMLASQKYRSPKAQSFLGVPTSPQPVPEKDLTKADTTNSSYFISVGTHNKYQFDKTDVFLNFIEFLCGTLDQKLKLVGPPNGPHFAKLSAKARSNLEVPGILDRTETLELVANSLAYIDSFPECGGTSVVNAMKIGLPIFGFRQSEGMYGEDFLADSFDGLCENIKDFLENGYDREILETRRNFIKNELSIQACLKRLNKTIEGQMCPIPYEFDPDKIDLDYYHKKWLDTDDLYIPPAIKINQPS
jgi:hypothetical protein